MGEIGRIEDAVSRTPPSGQGEINEEKHNRPLIVNV